MITFDQTDKLDVLPDQLNNRSGATILENLTTAFDSNKYIGGAGVNSEALAAQEIWGPIIDELRTNGILDFMKDFRNLATCAASSS